jgi:hypothetical protein
MKVLIAGDFCQDYGVNDLVLTGRYNFFDKIKPIVQEADYSIVNFEFPVVSSPDSAHPIYKAGPCLKGTLEGVKAVKYVGFDCCTLANNHTLDQGEQCLLDTVEAITQEGLDCVGAGANLEEAGHTLYKEINGQTLAIINCCEHEFTIATDNAPGANPLKPIRQYYKIKEAREKADYVLVIVHGGHEHYQLPSVRMQDTYRFFVDAGADAVVNHHQHCYSGFEIYKGKPIFYGLGNLLFDDPLMKGTKTWHEGYMAVIDFCKDGVSYKQVPYSQCRDDISVTPFSKAERESFDKHISELNTIIADRQRLLADNEVYYERCARGELINLEPYRGRVLVKLFLLGLLPRCIKNNKLLGILNHINCESHRDKLLYALKKQKAQYDK